MIVKSPIGNLKVEATNNGVESLSVVEDLPVESLRPHPLARLLSQQLRAYFAGTLEKFELPIYLRGTAFETRVWQMALQIPFGSTMSYAELGKRIGLIRGFQAIGQALKKNPLLIIVPCHRVVASSGEIGGYRLGTEIKSWLLNHEGIEIDKPYKGDFQAIR